MRDPLPTSPRGGGGTPKRPNDKFPKRLEKHEEFKMEDGDSDTDKYPHRTGHNAGHDFVHGTWTVQFLRKPLPNPSPKREGLLVAY